MLIYGFFKAVELLSFHNMTAILIIPQLPSRLQCVCNEIVFFIWLMHWKLPWDNFLPTGLPWKTFSVEFVLHRLLYSGNGVEHGVQMEMFLLC